VRNAPPNPAGARLFTDRAFGLHRKARYVATVLPPLKLALTPLEVQEALGLDCVETARRMIRRGELPAKKTGRIWRVRRETVEAYRAGQTSEGDAVDAYVERLVEAAPQLTDEQRAKLAELLFVVAQRGSGATGTPGLATVVNTKQDDRPSGRI